MDSEVKNARVRIRTFVERYCAKSGTVTHPDKEVTEAVLTGLAANLATLASSWSLAEISLVLH